MAGVTSIDVKESLDDLAEKLRHVETATAKERLQVLYWLKQDNAPSYQCDCESGWETASRGANVVIELPRRRSESDVGG